MTNNDTIVALSTPYGVGGIAVVRLSGDQAISITQCLFKPKFGTKDLSKADSHTVHYGYIVDNDKTVDEVLIAIFKSPNSYTGEDVVEVSCHGSPIVQQEMVQTFIDYGARAAEAGEFTQRAFLNGKLDLSQTEAVADLIHAQSQLSKDIALNQLRGGFSNDLQEIRKKLLEFASLIELELDFSEEDVEFADRTQLETLVRSTLTKVEQLTHSFKLGNAIKNGINTAIVGKPNAGKSTLLNALLNEERAIVTEIPGTTRDTLEETMHINGILFRFIDTAGLRETQDIVEKIGVERARKSIEQSQVFIYLFDVSHTTLEELKNEIDTLPKTIPYIIVGNKSDNLSNDALERFKLFDQDMMFISALKKENIDVLKQRLIELLSLDHIDSSATIVTNARHYNALQESSKVLQEVLNSLVHGISGDLLAVDLRQALHHLGSITGEITGDDILGNIFTNFCIGK